MVKRLFLLFFLISFKLYATPFSSSNLPIFIFDTNNKEIQDEPKISATLKVVYDEFGGINNLNSTNFHFDGFCGVEFRGSFSQYFHKKNLSIETREDTISHESFNFPLLGLPEENDWVLVANFLDRSYLKNSLMYHLFRNTGNWAPNTKHVEVVINGEYMGLYVLTEKIKRDKNRVDIKKLESDDIGLPKISGGYLFSNNNNDDYEVGAGWSSQRYGDRKTFDVDHPSDPTAEQLAYIKDHVKYGLETFLLSEDFDENTSGIQNYIDVESFRRSVLFQEFSDNADAYHRSQYFSKDRNGKIKATTIWDFDFSFNKQFSGYNNPEDWKIMRPANSQLYWYHKFMEDCGFVNETINDYKDYRTSILDKDVIYSYLDSVSIVIADAAARDLDRWPDTGWIWSGTSVLSLNGEVLALKTWIDERLTWMDRNIYDLADNGPELVSSIDSVESGNSLQFTLSHCDNTDVNTYVENDKDTSMIFSTATTFSLPISVDSYVYSTCLVDNGCLMRSNRVKIKTFFNCDNAIDLNSVPDFPDYQEYKTSNSIIIDDSTDDNTMNLSAGSYILMEPGFTAQATEDTFVHASIDGCL